MEVATFIKESPVQIKAKDLHKGSTSGKLFYRFVLTLDTEGGRISLYFPRFDDMEQFRKTLWDAVESIKGSGA